MRNIRTGVIYSRIHCVCERIMSNCFPSTVARDVWASKLDRVPHRAPYFTPLWHTINVHAYTPGYRELVNPYCGGRKNTPWYTLVIVEHRACVAGTPIRSDNTRSVRTRVWYILIRSERTHTSGSRNCPSCISFFAFCGPLITFTRCWSCTYYARLSHVMKSFTNSHARVDRSTAGVGEKKT